MIVIDKLGIFQNSVGSFAIIDYTTPNGLETAIGVLEDVTSEGDIIIRHLDNPDIFWGFNISKVESYKFSPIKRRPQDG